MASRYRIIKDDLETETVTKYRSANDAIRKLRDAIRQQLIVLSSSAGHPYAPIAWQLVSGATSSDISSILAHMDDDTVSGMLSALADDSVLSGILNGLGVDIGAILAQLGINIGKPALPDWLRPSDSPYSGTSLAGMPKGYDPIYGVRSTPTVSGYASSLGVVIGDSNAAIQTRAKRPYDTLRLPGTSPPPPPPPPPLPMSTGPIPNPLVDPAWLINVHQKEVLNPPPAGDYPIPQGPPVAMVADGGDDFERQGARLRLPPGTVVDRGGGSDPGLEGQVRGQGPSIAWKVGGGPSDPGLDPSSGPLLGGHQRLARARGSRDPEDSLNPRAMVAGSQRLSEQKAARQLLSSLLFLANHG
jgi:hypothetical protein